MFCSSCGKQINTGARFCEYCGATQTPATAICSSCGKQINFGAKFCEHCGATQVVAAVAPSDNAKKSKYTKLEQFNIVGIAASLEASIAFEKDELKRIVSESFRDQPKEIDKISVWNKEFDSWMNIKQAKISFVQNDLKENLEALDVLYATTKIIPNAYRTANKLMWLYEDMSTSEHDIERAIDMLNHKETSDLLRKMNQNVDEVKATLAVGFTAMYSAIQDNNMLQAKILSGQREQTDLMLEIVNNQNAMLSQQSEMITDLGRIRKSAKIGNFLNVGSLIQNHKRNKMLTDIHNTLG